MDATYNQGAVTPDRYSQVLFDVPHGAVHQKPWRIELEGLKLHSSSDAQLGASENMLLHPNGRWMLRPHQWTMQWTQPEVAPGILPLGNFNATTQIKTIRLGRTYTPAEPAADQEFQGQYFLVREVAEGEDNNLELDADKAAFPQAFPDAFSVYPALRVLSQTGTLPENQGYVIRFVPPRGMMTHSGGPLFTFYFGGPVADILGRTLPNEETPQAPHGGEMALYVRANGSYELEERMRPDDEDSPWRIIASGEWNAAATIGGQPHALFIIPDGNDSVWITDQVPTIGSVAVNRNQFHRIGPARTTYIQKSSFTGDGPTRLDVRSDLWMPVQISKLTYPGVYDNILRGGVLRPAPFTFPYKLPEGTVIYVDLDAELPNGSEIVTRLYDVHANTEIEPEENGTFLSPAHASLYRVEFEFHPGINSSDTPRLRKATVRIEGITSFQQPVPFPANPRAYTVDGPTTSPDSESAVADFEDPGDTLTSWYNGDGGLGVHAGTHTIIRTRTDPADESSWMALFGGILASSRGEWWGEGDWEWPRPGAKTWRCAMAGMYHRLAAPGQTAWSRRVLSIDPNVPPDRFGRRTGWKITDIIRALLLDAGFGTDQVDIPNLPMRFIPNPKNAGDGEIQPGVRLVDVIEHLCRMYLGAFLYWDQNAGPLVESTLCGKGMWRLFRPPIYSADGSTYTDRYAIRQNFQLEGATGKAVHPVGAYATGLTYVTRMVGPTPEPPENNFVMVYAGPYLPTRSGPEDMLRRSSELNDSNTCVKVCRNPRSYDADPDNPTMVMSSPDRVGYMKPLIYVDPLLDVDGGGPWTDYMTSFVCRRLFDAVAYGRHWYDWEAPLVKVFDPSDEHLYGRPRPLRFGDMVVLDGKFVLLTSVEYQVPQSDLIQTAVYQGFVPPEPLEVFMGGMGGG